MPGTVMGRLDLTLEDVQTLHAALTPLIAKSRAAGAARPDDRRTRRPRS